MKVTREDIEWIKRLRGHGFSQEEIGKMLGHSQQVIGYQLAKLRAQLLKKYPFLDPTED